LVRAAALVIALLAATCASASVNMWFAGSPRETSAALANMCIAENAMIVEQDEFHVTCTKEITGLKGALTQFMIGNSYSTTPELHLRLAIVPTPRGTRVQAAEWAETQMAFGQVRRQAVEGGKADDELRRLLHNVGGQDAAPDTGGPVRTDGPLIVPAPANTPK
jgi:hypothetical protein